MTILVTGGAGFIGSNFVLDWLSSAGEPLVNLDKLTYAGNLANLASLEGDSRHLFVRGDICDEVLVGRLLKEHSVSAIVHFAAESHVDRSIHGPGEFVRTNVHGTYALLEQARAHWHSLPHSEQARFRFLHVSTDEVYGSLEPDEPPFTEDRRYAPNSPYSASKAASDHLVRAYFHTYGLPVITSNCSNNYGPLQFPEKLVPLTLLNALEEKPLPVYGDGLNVRDWLYVADHCEALRLILERGRPGETYNIGASEERTNIDVVTSLCSVLDRMRARKRGSYKELISYVKDRPGHDRRYAMDASKLRRELGWQPRETFSSGLERTVAWYMQNAEWVREVRSGDYVRWIEKNYAAR